MPYTTLKEQSFCGHRYVISLCGDVEGEYELPKASHRS